MSFYSNLDSRSLDADSPTIFEVISANELSSLLTPSLKYVLVHYTRRYPRYLLKVYSYFDELNLLGRLALEHSFLTKWNSTFTEKFYAIQRSSDVGLAVKSKKKKLTQSQIAGSLFFQVGIPYLRDKLDVVYEKWNGEYLIHKELYTFQTKDPKIFFKLLFLKLYPVISSGSTLLSILLQLLYLSGKGSCPSIPMYLLRMRYTRMEPEAPSLAPEDASKPRLRPPTLGEALNESSLIKLLKLLKGSFLNIVDTMFPVLMFLLRFLEWWQQNDSVKSLFAKKNFLKQTLETSKSFPIPKIHIDYSKIRSNKYLRHQYEDCVICKNRIQNPAVIETGYVFCYPCIMKHLTESTDAKTGGRCPVTGIKLLGCSFVDNRWKVEGIIRLMV